MTHVIRSIDALISGIPEAQPINPANSPAANSTQNSPKIDDKAPNVVENDAKSKDNLQELGDQEDISQDENDIHENRRSSSKLKEDQPKIEDDKKTSDTDMDEYGNPVAKPKTYTEEQVQQMMRERLKRGQFRQEQPPRQEPPTQQAGSEGFQYNENSELSWSQQMEMFVENTMEKVSQRKTHAQQAALQRQAQEDFEAKFHVGMAKYPDFVKTMEDKLVTNDMVMAIRGLDNPAAFLYTAAKRMPAELDRISKIRDPYVQVAEMGRLHEKLSKPKPSSNSPKPLSRDRSDISEKAPPARVPIEHLIDQDAKGRYKR